MIRSFHVIAVVAYDNYGIKNVIQQSNKYEIQLLYVMTRSTKNKFFFITERIIIYFNFDNMQNERFSDYAHVVIGDNY